MSRRHPIHRSTSSTVRSRTLRSLDGMAYQPQFVPPSQPVPPSAPGYSPPIGGYAQPPPGYAPGSIEYQHGYPTVPQPTTYVVQRPPWPQRPAGLVDTGFKELADRWLPILNVFDENGVDLCYEIHPGEDLHDGISYEMFLEKVNNHPRACLLYDPSHFVLQCLNYLEYIDNYHERIRMFHVKDAEFNPTGKQGVYGGYQGWVERAGRFRSLGDGQVDFGAVFSKMTANNFDGWAVVEWECALKHPEDGAREGAEFVAAHIIRVTEKAFDDFAGSGTDQAANRRMLGL